MLLLAVSVTACKKSSVGPDPGPVDTTTAPAGNFYKLIRVENFKGDTTDADPTAPKATLFYSLEENVDRSSNYQKTSKWDISLGGLYNSFFAGNNGLDVNNWGYGTSARGGIIALKQRFEDVIDIPGDDLFKTGKDLIGTDDAGAFGSGIGWYLYDFGGDIVGDKSYDKQHVCYALGSGITLADGSAVGPRTLVFRTANGHYAKVRMISVYKDAFAPDKWFRNTPHMYFTFEYVMVPKGSKKFEIR
jgi:hypothetical protein